MQPTLPDRLSRPSKITRPALVAAASLLLAVACRDATAPAARAIRPSGPSRDISDAAHGGTAHFYFLPPLVPQPAYAGTADGTHAPEVVVCDVGSARPGPTATCAAAIARFTTTSGTGSQVIRYDATSQLYVVNWQTDQCTASGGGTVACTLNTSHFYRLFVRERVGGSEMGHVDIDPVASASDLHDLSTGGVIPLVNGRTLPIKFRIEQGLRLGYTFAFQSDRTSGISALWVMNTDGTGALPITTFEAASPSWSPDGTRLTFDGGGCCNRQIYAVNADGTGLVNLTQDGADNVDPDWSPDGTKIAYSNTAVWVMAADGSSRQLLAGGAGGAGSPKWSPDGTKIAYASVVGSASQLFVMNADGSGVRQLTSDPANPSSHPSWSPDGSRILFDRCVGGNSPYPWICPTQTDIFAMNADGTNVQNLTNTPLSNEGYARFTPDGARVGFHSDRDGHLQVYLMDASGANQVNVSNNGSREASPAFKP